MAYEINVRTGLQARRVAVRLRAAVEGSRFTVGQIDTVHRPRNGVELRLFVIRLKQTKDYCGNHPGPCRLSNRRHHHHKFLEGADWVEFNDLVNDVLDRLRLDADVGSTTCWVRRGGKRRICYDAITRPSGHVDWDRTGEPSDYRDCRGIEAPPSSFPAGTPGLYSTRPARSREGAA